MTGSLASVHPELIPEWSEKNLPLTPDRSGQAVSYLKQIGYTNAKNIGGISSYRGKVVK